MKKLRNVNLWQIFFTFASTINKRSIMIQRIQSLYLFIAVIMGMLLFFFPVATFYHEILGNYRLMITGVESMDPTPKVQFSPLFTSPLWIINIIAIILSVVTLVLYKNRILQIRFIAFAVLFDIVLVVLIFLFYTNKIQEITQIEPSYRQAGIFFPLIALLFLILANRSIRRDEAKVKSADRLR